jgi:ubiquitin C-terminal hydrolase
VVEEDNDNKSDDIASRLNQENYLKRNKSYVSGLMVGQFKSTIRCPTSKCNRVAVNFDAFMTVSLPILQPVEVALYFVPKELVAHVEKVVLGLTVR